MLEFLIENNVVCRAVEAMAFASVACSILGVIISKMNLSSIWSTIAHATIGGAPQRDVRRGRHHTRIQGRS